ncbi:DUF1643 domain-containing protein [Cryobacterium sp. Hh11]|nr:DUF1643 domain-containing protein [Cryobacterium sp. Hh11]
MYRYRLSREWSAGRGAMFVIPTPSIADQGSDDPTFRRFSLICRRRAGVSRP